jgi:hypothetical protein
MVFNATFNNISAISWWSVLIGGRNQSTRREPPTLGKHLVNFITCECEFTKLGANPRRIGCCSRLNFLCGVFVRFHSCPFSVDKCIVCLSTDNFWLPPLLSSKTFRVDAIFLIQIESQTWPNELVPDYRIPYCRFHFAESHIADCGSVYLNI